MPGDQLLFPMSMFLRFLFLFSGFLLNHLCHFWSPAWCHVLGNFWVLYDPTLGCLLNTGVSCLLYLDFSVREFPSGRAPFLPFLESSSPFSVLSLFLSLLHPFSAPAAALSLSGPQSVPSRCPWAKKMTHTDITPTLSASHSCLWEELGESILIL